MSRKTTIMDLDDYSLSYLFSFLPMMDLITIGDSCLRFKTLIGPLIGKKRFSQCENLFEFGLCKKIYADYGEFIRNIAIGYTFCRQDEDELVSKYCHNIEIAEIAFSPFTHVNSGLLKDLIASNKNIKHLTFSSRDCINILCEYISELKNLEILNVRGNDSLTGEHLSRLTNLKEINFERCEKLDSDNFIGICKANKFLKLNISGCCKLNTEAFRTLVGTQTELEEITVDHWYKDGEVAQIALLENLRKVHVKYTQDLVEEPNSLLRKVSEQHPCSLKNLIIDCDFNRQLHLNELERILKFKNLEELKLFRVCNLNDSLLTQISKTCKLLQRVTVSSGQITIQGIIQLIRNLKFLMELDLTECLNLCGALYQDICEAKRTSDNKIKLKMHANTDFLNNVSEKQYNMNQNLVQLFYLSQPFNAAEWDSEEWMWMDETGSYNYYSNDYDSA